MKKIETSKILYVRMMFEKSRRLRKNVSIAYSFLKKAFGSELRKLTR